MISNYMRPLHLVLLLLVCAAFISCSDYNELNRKLAFGGSGLKIEADLHNFEYREFRDNVSTFVNGQVVVHNTSGETIPFMLSKVHLKSGDKIGMLSFGNSDSVVVKMMNLPADSTYTADVYWAFTGKLDPDSSGVLSLGYE